MIDGDAPLASALGFVERHVGAAQQLADRVHPVSRSDADRGRDRDRLQRDLDGRLDELEQGAGKALGNTGVAGEQDRELITAEPADRAPATDPRGKPPGDLREHQIAHRMPEAVVDLLEAIEVDQQQLVAGRQRQGALDGGLQAAPVGEPGQRVVIREMARARLARRQRVLAELGAVQREHDEAEEQGRRGGYLGQRRTPSGGARGERGPGQLAESDAPWVGDRHAMLIVVAGQPELQIVLAGQGAIVIEDLVGDLAHEHGVAAARDRGLDDRRDRSHGDQRDPSLDHSEAGRGVDAFWIGAQPREELLKGSADPRARVPRFRLVVPGADQGRSGLVDDRARLVQHGAVEVGADVDVEPRLVELVDQSQVGLIPLGFVEGVLLELVLDEGEQRLHLPPLAGVRDLVLPLGQIVGDVGESGGRHDGAGDHGKADVPADHRPDGGERSPAGHRASVGPARDRAVLAARLAEDDEERLSRGRRGSSGAAP